MSYHDEPSCLIKTLCSPNTGSLFSQVLYVSTDDRAEFLNRDKKVVMTCTADGIVQNEDGVILGRIRRNADKLHFYQADTSPVTFGEVSEVSVSRIEAYLDIERLVFLRYLSAHYEKVIAAK